MIEAGHLNRYPETHSCQPQHPYPAAMIAVTIEDISPALSQVVLQI